MELVEVRNSPSARPNKLGKMTQKGVDERDEIKVPEAERS
jgi:hypothetical protein